MKAKFLKRSLMVVLFMLAIVPMLQAQTKVTVSGTVTDQSGEPLIGVSVLDKNTKAGTATDVDGNFTVTVNKGTVLQFSYVGCKPAEYKVNGPKMNVTLAEDNMSLDELVVVGYGVQKRR